MPESSEATDVPGKEINQPYLVEQYELYVSTYKVIATSAADAIAQVLENKGESTEEFPEYLEPCDALGMPVEGNEELAEQLSERDVYVDEDVIPTIRRVQRLIED